MSIDLRNIETTSPKKRDVLKKTLNKDIQLGKGELSSKKKEDLYSELGILIGSGLDIKSSLLVLIGENNKKTKQFYQNIYDQLIKGVSLSDALQLTGKISMYEYYTLRIGEETGNLIIVLKQLAQHFAESIKQKRQLINTFSYPGLVICTAIVVVLFMMNFIVPMFEELFKRFHGELPALTRAVILASKFISKYLWGMVLFLLGLGFTLFYIRRTRFYRKITSEVMLKTPGINTVIRKMYLAKFCQTFSLLNSSRIPIVTSIQLIQKIIGFYPFEIALIQIEKDLINGKLLHESFRSFDIFEEKLITLTKVGEEVNKLSDIYENLSQQYTEEVQHKVAILNTLMEPILIIFIGLFVAVILISMYLPMFKMSNTMF
ncbi:MAG TPA: type II secretion system F family protein [Prolixibacteraceae bacterium]|nr:type II secretion system F family protein [Prolixibacteraceae bacterium]